MNRFVVILCLLFSSNLFAQRTDVTVTSGLTQYPTAGISLVQEAADTVNQNAVTLSGNGKELLVAHNTGAGAHNITINSVSLFGRTGDITNDSIGASSIKLYGAFALNGWRQSSGKLHFEADSTEVLFSVIRLP